MFRSEIGPMLKNYKALRSENLKNYKKKLAEDLLSAVIVGDTVKVAALLAKKISTDIRDMNGRHLLAIAADKGHEAIVKLLLKHNPTLITTPSTDGITPLFLAVSKGHTKVVALLAEQKSIDVNECVNGFAPIYMAASKGYHAIVKCLLAHGADANQTYENMQTTLSAAINSGNINTVDTLLKYNADVNKPDADGMTPFDTAVHYQNVEICKLILKYAPTIDINKNDILFKAISNLALLSLLLEQKVDIDKLAEKSYHNSFFSEIKKGSTPLLAAIHVKEKTQANHAEKLKMRDASIRLILDNKPNVNISDVRGDSPLHHAVFLRDTALARALLEQKANVNSYSDKNLSPLIIATINNNAEMLQLLIEHKADLELTGKTSVSPLMHAVISESYDALVTLLENKANINSKDVNGLTPLFYAIIKYYKNLEEINSYNSTTSESHIQAFFEKDKGLTDKQKKGLMTALKPSLDKLFNSMENSKKLLSARKIMNSEKIIKTLIDHKAPINIHSISGSTPLITAVECQLNDVLKVLLESKTNVDVNLQTNDKAGYTALHTAAIFGNETACNLLLAHKADINKLDNNGKSPLHYAVLNAHHKVVKILLAHGASLNDKENSMIDAEKLVSMKTYKN